jgi:type 1 fimbriae regulatory protein FimB/type 1 fimbriae regulatory protein FimE
VLYSTWDKQFYPGRARPQCNAARPRAKNGKPSAHPLRGDEVRALRELRRQFPDSAFVFPTERGGPFTPDAVNRLIQRIGDRARFAFPVHVHMLRHACGYALANAGHDTRRIQMG